MKDKILKRVLKFYLNSKDFNGYSIATLLYEFDLDSNAIKTLLIELILENKIEINFGVFNGNSHIKSGYLDTPEIQIEKLKNIEIPSRNIFLNITKEELILKKIQLDYKIHGCIYPSVTQLKNKVSIEKYSNRPFTLKLALGEPQLQHYVFDLNVLEIYRNNPKFKFSFNGISGSIYLKGEHFDSVHTKKRDKVFMKLFGMAYKNKYNRFVCTTLTCLSDLSPEHQAIWSSNIKKGKFKLHEDYTKILKGDWSVKISIYDAIIYEMVEINKLSQLMKGKDFFRELFDEHRPDEFCTILRPTLKEFNDYIHTLDKMISENINKNFFKNDIDEHFLTKSNTLTILKEWLNKLFSKSQAQPQKQIFLPFMEIRTLRNKPAHKIEKNEFDNIYFKKQILLNEKIYYSLESLRIVFSSHPRCNSYSPNKSLEEGVSNC